MYKPVNGSLVFGKINREPVLYDPAREQCARPAGAGGRRPGGWLYLLPHAESKTVDGSLS